MQSVAISNRFGIVLALAIWLVLSVAPCALAQSGLPPVRRPTAPEIQQAALNRIDAAVGAATDRLEVLVERAVFRLELLGTRGVSRVVLERTALKFKKPFGGVARGAVAQINREIGNAMIRMRSADGHDRELEQELNFRRETAIAELRDAIESAEAALDAAIAPAGG